MMKLAIVAAGGLLAAGLLAGCGNESQEDGADVPSSAIKDGTRMGVMRMPDGFRNVAYGCVNGDLVYVTSRGNPASDTSIPSSVVVLPDDPYCSA